MLKWLFNSVDTFVFIRRLEIRLTYICDTIHEKVPSLIVHSFVRNQPVMRWGSIFAKKNYFRIVMTHLCSVHLRL